MFCLSACFAWLLALPVLYATPSSSSSLPQVQLHQYQLANGLRLLLQPIPESGLVQLQLRYEVGEADVKRSGLPHLTEHLLVMGSHFSAAWWAERNGWTAYDRTVFTSLFPAEALKRALFEESVRMQHPCQGIAEDELVKQKNMLLLEYQSAVSQSFTYHIDVMRKVVFHSTPVGRPVYGQANEFMSLTKQHVCRFLTRWYIPNNAELVLVGDFHPQEVKKDIERWFAGIPSRPLPKRLVTAAQIRSQPRQNSALYIPAKEEAASLYIGWLTPPRGHADRLPLQLLSELLVHPQEGLLAKTGVSAFGHLESHRFGGMFVLELVGTKHSQLIHIVQQQLQKLKQVKTWQLQSFQRRMFSRYRRGLQSFQLRSQLLSGCVPVGKTSCLHNKMTQRQAVTTADLQRLARRYLSPQQAHYISVAPSLSHALSGAQPYVTP